HRRTESKVVDKLKVLERGAPDELVLQSLDGRFGSDLAGIAERSGLALEEVKTIAAGLEAAGRVVRLGDRFASSAAFAAAREEAEKELRQFHRRYPLRQGMSREELKSRLRLTAREA